MVNQSSGKWFKIKRLQMGGRIEKRLVKGLKALVEYWLGDLPEGIVPHSFEGKSPFSGGSLEPIQEFKDLYRLDLEDCTLPQADFIHTGHVRAGRGKGSFRESSNPYPAIN